jgi:peptidoglycan hydrolase-like amidase
MRRRILFACLVAVGALYERPARSQTAPTVRIGLTQNAATVSIRSAEDFTIQQNRTRTARFSMVLTVDPSASNRVLTRNDLQYRGLVEIDAGKILVLSSATRIRIEPKNSALIEFDNKLYRGAIEVFPNPRNSFTVVNELPIEDYLPGVVPNELSPTTYGEIEALKAQAVAARTYAVRNLGQSKNEGYDICASDACQVYLGAGSQHPLSTQAVEETRGVIATYKDEPINALYSSTCGGRTEDAENIFDEKVPYLVSTICEYKHPEPLPCSTTPGCCGWDGAGF